MCSLYGIITTHKVLKSNLSIKVLFNPVKIIVTYIYCISLYHSNISAYN